jgi:hypothetical protein
MPELNVIQCDVNGMERAVRNPRNLRIGATSDPLARARSYAQNGANGYFFQGTMYYTWGRNARRTEDHLLAISLQRGLGRLNVQWSSNYADTPAYVYCIVGRIVPPVQHQQHRRHPHYHSQNDCCIS